MTRSSSAALLALAIGSCSALREWVHEGVRWTGQIEAASPSERFGAEADLICEDASVRQLSGYFKVEGDNKKNLNYFFWFFEAREQPTEPTTAMWLTGGPGCSSMLALASENGPCMVNHGVVPPAASCTASGLSRTQCGNATMTHAQCSDFGCCYDGKTGENAVNCFQPDAVTMQSNPYSWNSNSNMMWIDQPAGVGYSYGDLADYDKDEAGVAEDMFHFLNEFMAQYPEYEPNPFFVFGESYGGHYAPAVADRLLKGIQNKTSNMNLHGLGVGNGLTDPSIQYQYYAQMAYNNSYGIQTISKAAFDKMNKDTPACIAAINECQDDTTGKKCKSAQTSCNNALIGPYEATGLNPYNIMVECDIPGLCYDFSAEGQWLNQDSVRSAIGVSPEVKSWQSCNNVVNAMFSADWMRNYQDKVSDLLEGGVRVLIYAGDLDFICNWMGNKAWTLALPWHGQSDFVAAQDVDWSVSGSKAGTVRTAQNFTFLQVNMAGHMVPADQPENALSMFNTFVSGGKF